MLDYNDIMTLTRINPVDGSKQVVYTDLVCDIQINESKKYANGNNSDNSEMADFFIFTTNENNNIKVGDIISFNNDFGEEVFTKVMSRDFIDFESMAPFIEILVKLK